MSTPAHEIALIDLSPEEVKRLPKPKGGFLRFAAPLLALYETNGSALGSGLDAEAARASLSAVEALDAGLDAERKHLEMVQETRLLHASTVWMAMLDVYARARAAARHDPELARAVADFERFMRKPRKNHPSAA
jgi:hypothetical protein